MYPISSRVGVAVSHHGPPPLLPGGAPCCSVSLALAVCDRWHGTEWLESRGWCTQLQPVNIVVAGPKLQLGRHAPTSLRCCSWSKAAIGAGMLSALGGGTCAARADAVRGAGGGASPDGGGLTRAVNRLLALPAQPVQRAVDETCHSAAPPPPFSRRFNSDGEGMSAQ